MKAVTHTEKGTVTTTLQDDIILNVLRGYISGAVAEEGMTQIRALTQELRAEGKSPKLAIDISGITGQSSEARTVAKRIGAVGLDRIAIFGGSRSLTMVGQYLARAAGITTYTKFFHRQDRALAWLQLKTVHRHENRMRRIVATIAFGIALAAFIGWISDISLLRTILPGLKAMNPMVAILLMVMAGLIFTYRTGAASKGWHQIARGIGLISIVFGTSVFVGYFSSFDLGIDTWLFSSMLEIDPISGRAAPGVALCLTLFGGMLILVTAQPMKDWHRRSFHAASASLFIIITLILIAYIFGLNKKIGFLPTPLNTALCLILLNHAMQTITNPLPFFARSKQTVDKYWQAAVIFIAIMSLTGIAFQQSRVDIEVRHARAVQSEIAATRNGITDRTNAYINALHGFRAFFESSELVNPDEFNSYFKNSQLAENYPGFNAITFLRNVPRDQKDAFIQEIHGLADAGHQHYKEYRIFPNSSSPSLFPLLYYQPQSSNRPLGFDLSSNSVRRDTLERARDTGEPAASSEINLNESRADRTEHRAGFFIAMPVYKSSTTPKTLPERRQQIYGFVNAVFEDKRLFSDILKSTNNEVEYTIRNARTNTILYKQNKDLSNKTLLRQEHLTIAGQPWNIAIYGSPNFGVSMIERNLPASLLTGGSLIAFLAALLFIAQVRRRSQALELATQMTEDLSNERNQAVATQQKNEAVLSSIGDAVFAIDTKERITLFNPAAERVSGFSALDAIGKPYKEVLEFASEKDNTPDVTFIKKALTGKLSAMKANTILLRKDGQRVPVADSAAPIRNAKGTLLGAIIVFRDVSKERELDKAKTEFVSLASHQLRTPLSSIGWYSEMLLGGDAGKLTKQQREYLMEIHEGNGRMVELVNSLLDVSRLDLGKLTNTPQPVIMRELIQNIETELMGSIQSKKLKVTKKIKKVAPVMADPKLMRMIVQNLMSNAVKYTAANGSVVIELRHVTNEDMKQAGLTSHKPHIYFSIKDTGYGIPKAQQNKIFGKLFRADNVRALDVEGTGLGLYIVKEVVRKLNGRVWFESMESVGTTFHVILPEYPKTSRTKQGRDKINENQEE